MSGNRTLILTKGTGKFSNQLLIIDVSTSVNHNFGSAVAKHPVEGQGYSLSDHQFNRNNKIQIQGMISKAWPTKPNQTDTEGRSITDNQLSTNTSRWRDLRVKVLNNTATLDEISEFSTVESWISRRTGAQRLGLERKGIYDFRVIQQTNNGVLSDEEMAYDLIKAIRDNHILCDVTTMYDVYENMALTNITLPRQTGPQALFLDLTFEQQRFSEVIVTNSFLYKDGAGEVIEEVDNGKKKTKKKGKLDERTKDLVERTGYSDRDELDDFRFIDATQ